MDRWWIFHGNFCWLTLISTLLLMKKLSTSTKSVPTPHKEEPQEQMHVNLLPIFFEFNNAQKLPNVLEHACHMWVQHVCGLCFVSIAAVFHVFMKGGREIWIRSNLHSFYPLQDLLLFCFWVFYIGTHMLERGWVRRIVILSSWTRDCSSLAEEDDYR